MCSLASSFRVNRPDGNQGAFQAKHRNSACEGRIDGTGGIFHRWEVPAFRPPTKTHWSEKGPEPEEHVVAAAAGIFEEVQYESNCKHKMKDASNMTKKQNRVRHL